MCFIVESIYVIIDSRKSQVFYLIKVLHIFNYWNIATFSPPELFTQPLEYDWIQEEPNK